MVLEGWPSAGMCAGGDEGLSIMAHPHAAGARGGRQARGAWAVVAEPAAPVSGHQVGAPGAG
eukprot:scaffold19953_cov95-Isochrysis_galbana.AAC.3